MNIDFFNKYILRFLVETSVPVLYMCYTIKSQVHIFLHVLLHFELIVLSTKQHNATTHSFKQTTEQ